MKARLRPLALQASAAERAEKLRGEIAALRARVAQLDLAGVEERSARPRSGVRGSAGAPAHRETVRDAAARAQAGRGGAGRRGGTRRGADRGALPAAERRRADRAPPRDRRDLEDIAPRPRAGPRQFRGPAPRSSRGAQKRPLRASASATRSRRAGGCAAARALAGRARGDSAGGSRPGRGGRAAGARLARGGRGIRARGRGRARLARRRPGRRRRFGGVDLVERARAAGLGSLHVLVGDRASELVRRAVVVPMDRLLDSPVLAVTPEGHGFDPEAGELWFAGETAEAVLLELEARRRALAEREAEGRGRTHEAETPHARPSFAGSTAAVRRSPALLQIAGAARLAGRARGRGRGRGSRRRSARASTRAPTGPASWRRSCGAWAAERPSCAARRGRGGRAGSRRSTSSAPGSEPRPTRRGAGSRRPARSRPTATTVRRSPRRLERLERRRETLGQVNPLAKEEYEREKERLEELAPSAPTSRQPEELEQLRAELTETVERRFEETFAAVREHFEEVAATLFPGGEGRLRMTEPEEDGAEPASRSSCVRPASGHAAVAALGRREGARRDLVPVLALSRAPVPVLPARRGGGRPRRHEHRPLRASCCAATPTGPSSSSSRTRSGRWRPPTCLYGVTMGGDGVSQIVSRRLPREETTSAAA